MTSTLCALSVCEGCVGLLREGRSCQRERRRVPRTEPPAEFAPFATPKSMVFIEGHANDN